MSKDLSNFVRSWVLGTCVFAHGAAAAEGPWADGFNNKARLVAGRDAAVTAGSSELYAGLEISMSPGFKTYWRNPGEAGGVAPEFDFSGSSNLAEATVLYPAPHRTKDKAGENIGYKDAVIFPIRVTAKDKTKPVALKLKAAYGVCKDICIPAETELSLDIAPDEPVLEPLAEALKSVPVSAAASVDPKTTPQLAAWRVERDGKSVKLVLDVNDPGGEDGDAFLYSGDGLYMPMTVRTRNEGLRSVFEANLTDGVEAKDLAGKTVSLTLTGALGQSETMIALPNDLGTQ